MCEMRWDVVRRTFFFFNDTATTEIYTLSLHDALPISPPGRRLTRPGGPLRSSAAGRSRTRSEEHTSELQSQSNLVCRLLLEKKKKNTIVRDSSPNARSSHFITYPYDTLTRAKRRSAAD